MKEKNILMTGATGLIGSALVKKLSEKGYTVVILSTSQSNPKLNIFKWNPALKVCDALPNIDFYAVINLAGASIADTRWNSAGKELIKNSRIESLNYLKNIINKLPNPPKHCISASAIGYYGLINNEIKTEESSAANDFAAGVCLNWESAAGAFKTHETHLSILRIGIVLAQKGGFYKKIKDLAGLKIAAPLGNGKQPVCWIHIFDLVNIFISILENDLKPGIYNAVSKINTNKEITNLIAHKNSQPFTLPPIPTFLLKLLLGEKAEMITQGAEVSGAKLVSEGFRFKYNDLETTISDLVKG